MAPIISLPYFQRKDYDWVIVCFIFSLLGLLSTLDSQYGVATISRLLKIIGLFCKRAQ